MKTQDQKHDDKFTQRIARLWCKSVDWAEDIDFGEICLNIFLVLLVGGTIFAVSYLALFKSDKDKKADSVADSVAAVEAPRCTKKSCRIDWDLDTVTVLAPNEKGYKLQFKGKVPYYLVIENLDTVQ